MVRTQLGAVDCPHIPGLVRENEFTGMVPTNLGSMTALELLAWYTNQLRGTVPTNLRRLAALTALLSFETHVGLLNKLERLSLLRT